MVYKPGWQFIPGSGIKPSQARQLRVNCTSLKAILSAKQKVDEVCSYMPLTVCFYHMYIKSCKSSKLHKDFMDTLYIISTFQVWNRKQFWLNIKLFLIWKKAGAISYRKKQRTYGNPTQLPKISWSVAQHRIYVHGKTVDACKTTSIKSRQITKQLPQKHLNVTEDYISMVCVQLNTSMTCLHHWANNCISLQTRFPCQVRPD